MINCLKSFLVILIFMSITVNSFSKTYFLRADGISKKKIYAEGPCSDITACMSIPIHNKEIFRPGDKIILCDSGGIFREQLEPPSSGSSEMPIVYHSEKGGKPTVSALEVPSDWIRNFDLKSEKGRIYTVVMKTRPKVVLFGSTIGREEVLNTELDSKNEWFWEKIDGIGTLFVYTLDTPHHIQVDVRKHAMLVKGKKYLSFYDISFAGGRSAYGSVYFKNNSSHIIIDNCSFEYAFANGLRINKGNPVSNNIVTNSYFAWNGNDGAFFARNEGIIFSNNKALGNGWGSKGDRQAVGFWNCTDAKIYQNVLHHSGNGDALEFTGKEFSSVSGEIFDNKFINRRGKSKQTVEIGRGKIIFHNNLIVSHPKAIGVYTGDGFPYKVQAKIHRNKIVGAKKSIAVYDNGSVHPETKIEIIGNISCNPSTHHLEVKPIILKKTYTNLNRYYGETEAKFRSGGKNYNFFQWKDNFSIDKDSSIHSSQSCD